MTDKSRRVIYEHRRKRPPKKRKNAALDCRRLSPGPTSTASPKPLHHPRFNDDRKPAIVTITDRKRQKVLRAERRADASAKREIDPEVKAFRPHDPPRWRTAAEEARRMMRPPRD